MSVSDRNASIVNKTKKLLKEYGYEVKLNHLYNVFSKLSNESSWNVAKAKGTEFNTLLENQEDFIIPGNSFKKDTVIPASQINQILDRMTKTLYFCLEMDREQECRPNHLLNTFTKSSKIAKGESSVIECLNKLYGEFDRRRRFTPSSIEKFNPIMIYFDGFYQLFKNSSNEELKNKLIELWKYSRSVGFIVYLAPSFRATKSDVPPEVIQNFVSKNIFKINKDSSSYLIQHNPLKKPAPEINFIGSSERHPESGSESSIIIGVLQPTIITRLVNYDPNSFKFYCAELTKDILD